MIYFWHIGVLNDIPLCARCHEPFYNCICDVLETIERDGLVKVMPGYNDYSQWQSPDTYGWRKCQNPDGHTRGPRIKEWW